MDALVLQCEQCGKPLPAPKRGQVRKYCSSRCRKAAFRASLCVPKPELSPSVGFMRSTAPTTLPGAPERQEEARNPSNLLPEGSYEVPFPLEYYEDGFPQLPACLNRRNREGGER